MRIDVTKHCLERYRERFDKRARYKDIREMVINALVGGYPLARARLTFGIVTFVVQQWSWGFYVITCFKAETAVTPADVCAPHPAGREVRNDG